MSDKIYSHTALLCLIKLQNSEIGSNKYNWFSQLNYCLANFTKVQLTNNNMNENLNKKY